MDLQYKPWPCCRFFHSQLDVLKELMRVESLQPQDIASIESRGLRFVANRHPYDVHNAIDVQFSLPFCLALVAHGVPPGARWQDQRALGDARLHEFARRVRIHADPRASALKGSNPKSWWAAIELSTADGRRFEREREHADGTNGTPYALGDEALAQKFRAHATPILGEARSDKLLAALWSIDQLNDTRQLSELMAPS